MNFFIQNTRRCITLEYQYFDREERAYYYYYIYVCMYIIKEIFSQDLHF